MATNDILRTMWREVQDMQWEEARRRAEADPEKYKLSRFLARGVSASDYTYYSCGRDGRKAFVRWCFMNKPNVAGYYLCWRERVTGRTVKRTHYTAWKTAGRAETQAMRKWKREREKLRRAVPTEQ